MTMTQHYFPRVWPIGTEITAAGIFLCGNLIAKSSLPDPRRVQTESSRAGPALVQGFDSFLNPAPVLAPGGLAHRGTEGPAKSNASRSECRQNVSSHFCILHPLPGALLNLTRLRGMALMQVKRPLPDARRVQTARVDPPVACAVSYPYWLRVTARRPEHFQSSSRRGIWAGDSRAPATFKTFGTPRGFQLPWPAVPCRPCRAHRETPAPDRACLPPAFAGCAWSRPNGQSPPGKDTSRFQLRARWTISRRSYRRRFDSPR